MTTKPQIINVVIGLCAAVLLISCKREIRSFHPTADASEMVHFTRLSELQAGGPSPEGKEADSQIPVDGSAPKYEENAHALSEGKRLYSAYNCVGCHAHGGGGM